MFMTTRIPNDSSPFASMQQLSRSDYARLPLPTQSSEGVYVMTSFTEKFLSSEVSQISQKELKLIRRSAWVIIHAPQPDPQHLRALEQCLSKLIARARSGSTESALMRRLMSATRGIAVEPDALWPGNDH